MNDLERKPIGELKNNEFVSVIDEYIRKSQTSAETASTLLKELYKRLAEPPVPDKAEGEKWDITPFYDGWVISLIHNGQKVEITKYEICNRFNFGEACQELLEDTITRLECEYGYVSDLKQRYAAIKERYKL